jgi:hypothetical protein
MAYEFSENLVKRRIVLTKALEKNSKQDVISTLQKRRNHGGRLNKQFNKQDERHPFILNKA